MHFDFSNLLYALIAMLESFVISFYFQRFLGKKYDKYFIYVIVYGGYFLLNYWLSAIVMAMSFKSLLTLAFPVIVSQVLYNGKLGHRCIAATLLISYIFISEIFVMSVLSWVNTYNFPIRPPDDVMYFVGAGLTSIVCLFIVWLVSRRQNLFLVKLPLKDTLFVVIMIVICVIIAYMDLVFGVYSTRAATLRQVISETALCLLGVMLYFVFERFQIDARSQTYDAMIRVQLEQMSIQFKMMEQFQIEERTKRHDFENHIQLIKQIAENGTPEELAEYVGGLVRSEEARTIKTVTGILSIDAIIAMKQTAAERQNISFNVRAAKLSVIHIDPVHLNIVLSNALDNALNACLSLPNGIERHIEVGLKTTGDFLYARITNSYLHKEAGRLKTMQSSQPNKYEHGLGLGSIKKTVEQYGGILSYEPDGGEFVVRIRMMNVALGEAGIT